MIMGAIHGLHSQSSRSSQQNEAAIEPDLPDFTPKHRPAMRLSFQVMRASYVLIIFNPTLYSQASDCMQNVS